MRAKEFINKHQSVTKGHDDVTAIFSGYGHYMNGRAPNVFRHYGITVLDKQYFEDEDIVEYTVSGSKEALDDAREYLERSDEFGGMLLKHGVAEEQEPFCEECGGSLWEAGKASRALCKSSRSNADLGVSQLASCKSQGLRARETNKKHTIGNKRVKIKGKQVKGHKYGGPLPYNKSDS